MHLLLLHPMLQPIFQSMIPKIMAVVRALIIQDEVTESTLMCSLSHSHVDYSEGQSELGTSRLEHTHCIDQLSLY